MKRYAASRLIMESKLNQVAIPVNKGKLLLGLLCMVVMLVAGIYLFNESPQTQSRRGLLRDPAVLQALGALLGVASVVALVMGGRMLVHQGPGLILQRDGLIVRPGQRSAELIPWERITRFDGVKFQSHRWLVAHVTHPEAHIERCHRSVKASYSSNLKRFGSPIVINAPALKIDFDELWRLCEQFRVKAGRS